LSVIDDALATWKSRLAEIEQQIGPLATEADALRAAISKVEGIQPTRSTRRARSSSNRQPSQTGARAARRGAARAPRGQNRRAILDAIRTKAKTAGDVAKETGIGRATVSTTLTKLVKDGAAIKADRGYTAA
jgi:hypothetical protein